MSNGILFLPDIMSEGFEKWFAAVRLWKDKSITEIFITVLQIICWTLEQLLNYHFKPLLSLFTFEAYIFIARKVNSKCLLSHKRTLSLILCTLSIASLCSFFKEKSLRFFKTFFRYKSFATHTGETVWKQTWILQKSSMPDWMGDL